MKTHQIVPAATLLMLLANTTFATVHYVNLNGTNPVAPYTNWVTAATNIQDAVTTAASGDTVLVTNGIYQYGTYPASGNNRVYVPNNLTVQSANGPAVTTIMGYQVPGTTNGANAVRCVFLSDGSTLSGFTLTNGATQIGGNGGGVCCQSLNSLITNCIIAGNAAYHGGGVYFGTVINCVLNGNSANFGSSAYGGGAYGSVMSSCMLSGNTAGYEGGGADHCTLTNCLICGNAVPGYNSGGGAGVCTLINCTVVGNSAYNGGGVFGGVLKNSIIYDNQDAVSEYWASNYFGGVFTNCATFPTPDSSSGMNNITSPPGFVNLAGGDYHLNAVSPCINAGNNSFITNGTDLDGNPRIFGGTVDIGAYEFQSVVHYVNLANPIPASPFTSWITAAANIQDAIDAASAGDSIVVSDGTYNTGGRVVYGSLTNRVVINKAVTVQSLNGPGVTVIQGKRTPVNSAMRCVYMANNAVLIGFTLTNGATRTTGDVFKEQSGGGVFCESISAAVSNCVIGGNSANVYGGGVSSGTLNNCTLTRNTAVQAGGGTFSSTLNNCTLSGNSSTSGGGACYGTLNNCLVNGNSARDPLGARTGEGGGTYSCTLTNCTLMNNSARVSGGGASWGSLFGCLIAGNTALQGGGAAPNLLVNCTVVGNSAPSDGGVGGGLGGGVLGGTVVNSILIHNTDTFGAPNYDDAILFFCCPVPDPGGTGNITNDPAFVDEAGGNYRLKTNSPCINSGSNASAPRGTDLDGNPRIVGGTVDIGAYEFQNPASILSYAWAQQYGLPTDGTADYADSDGDGMNNYQEWIVGTNPTNALSVLEMLNPTPTNIPVGLFLSWQSVNNRTYFLQSSTNLGAQPAFSTIQSNLVGQAGTTSYTDTNAVGNGPFFYRVGVQQ